MPHVAAGTKDSWTVSAVATNDVSVSNEETGTVTVDTVTGHDLAGDTDLSGNPGDSVTYHFTILNTGNAQEKMDYTVTSSWNVDTPGGSTTLDMGASDTISVTISAAQFASLLSSNTASNNIVAIDNTSNITVGSSSSTAGLTPNDLSLIHI